MKRFGILILLLLLLSASPVFARDSLLIDEAELISDSVEQALLEDMNHVSREYGVDIVINTVDSCQNLEPLQLAVAHWRNHGYGPDCVILLISKADRCYALHYLGGAHDALSEQEIDAIEQALVDCLHVDDYDGAALGYVESCAEKIAAWSAAGKPIRTNPIQAVEIVVILLIGFGIAAIVLFVMCSGHKTVKMQDSACVYLDRDKMEITESRDRFLYRTMHRTAKSDSSSSSGSRSSSRSGRY